MVVESKEAIFLTTIFVLPGFISTIVIRKTNPLDKSHIARYLIECLTFSIINIALFAWVYHFIFLIQNRLMFFIVIVLFALISSIVIGLICAYIVQARLIDRCMNLIGIKTINSIPSSWDYFFSRQVTCFIIIKMKNGTIMAGYYGVNSFSSSSIDERDIYVEKGFYMDANGNWNKDDESIGFYVNSKDIDSIEFKQVKIKEAQNE